MARIWPGCGQVWPGLARSGQVRVQVWPGLARSGQVWPGSGQVWPGSGQDLARSGQVLGGPQEGSWGGSQNLVFGPFPVRFFGHFWARDPKIEAFWTVFGLQKSRWHFFGKIEKSRYFETKGGVASVLGLAGYLSRFCQIKWS